MGPRGSAVFTPAARVPSRRPGEGGKPPVFIGSATEDLPLADAVFSELERVTQPTVWDQDVFEPSTFTLETLEGVLRAVDYAVLILGATDERTRRGATGWVPRDNVVAEFGLFVGALGRRRVFVLVPEEDPPELPTDMLGLVTLSYRTRSDGNLRASVRTACTVIKSVIERDAARSDAAGPAWPLHFAIVGSDDAVAARLATTLAPYAEILSTSRFPDVESARLALRVRPVDAMLIDIFSLGLRDGIDLIAYVRDRFREVGISLYGRRQELRERPGVEGIWKDTLEHYWQVPIDVNDGSLAILVEDVVLLLFLYRLSGGAFGERPGALARAIMRPDVAGTWAVWQRARSELS